MRTRYPVQAAFVYVALGIALGMVAWALFIHDSGGGTAGSGAQAPAHSSQR